MKAFNLFIGIFIFFIGFVFLTSFASNFNSTIFFTLSLLALLLFWILIENPDSLDGIILAFFAGLFWDIFSSVFIGFHIIILVSLAVFVKFILKNYVRSPFIGKI